MPASRKKLLLLIRVISIYWVVISSDFFIRRAKQSRVLIGMRNAVERRQPKPREGSPGAALSESSVSPIETDSAAIDSVIGIASAPPGPTRWNRDLSPQPDWRRQCRSQQRLSLAPTTRDQSGNHPHQARHGAVPAAPNSHARPTGNSQRLSRSMTGGGESGTIADYTRGGSPSGSTPFYAVSVPSASARQSIRTRKPGNRCCNQLTAPEQQIVRSHALQCSLACRNALTQPRLRRTRIG